MRCASTSSEFIGVYYTLGVYDTPGVYDEEEFIGVYDTSGVYDTVMSLVDYQHSEFMIHPESSGLPSLGV